MARKPQPNPADEPNEPAKHRKRTQNEYLNDEVIEAWKKANPDQDVNTREVAVWAIDEGLMRPPRSSAVDWAMGLLRRALREKYETDPQGRRVRSNHAYKETKYIDGEEKQLTFWVTLDADPKKIRMAFAWRRTSILGDCKQLKTDHDSYNDNNKHGAKLDQLSLDFTQDVHESEHPTDYPEARPYGEDEDTNEDEGEPAGV